MKIRRRLALHGYKNNLNKKYRKKSDEKSKKVELVNRKKTRKEQNSETKRKLRLWEKTIKKAKLEVNEAFDVLKSRCFDKEFKEILKMETAKCERCTKEEKLRSDSNERPEIMWFGRNLSTFAK